MTGQSWQQVLRVSMQGGIQWPVRAQTPGIVSDCLETIIKQTYGRSRSPAGAVDYGSSCSHGDLWIEE